MLKYKKNTIKHRLRKRKYTSKRRRFKKSSKTYKPSSIQIPMIFSGGNQVPINSTYVPYTDKTNDMQNAHYALQATSLQTTAYAT
jgi:hypothetical protein